MTRITFNWLMFIVGGGILLLACGESTVSAIAEQTTSNNKENDLLSVAVTTSPSVADSSASEYLQNESSSLPPEDNELKSNHTMEYDESSSRSSTDLSKDMTSVMSKSTSNETASEDEVSKAELQKSETKTELKIDESDMSNEVIDSIQNGSNSNSDTYLSTSEVNTAPVASENKKEVDKDSTNKEMSNVPSTLVKTVETSTEKEQSTASSLDTETDGKSTAHLSSTSTSMKEFSEVESNSSLDSEKTDQTTADRFEIDATEDSSAVETSGNPVTIETKSSLSSKSATKKRSINSTVTTTLTDESLPTSILFSSPSPQRSTESAISNEMSTSLSEEVDFSSPKSSEELVLSGELEKAELDNGTKVMSLPLVYHHSTEMEAENSQDVGRTENSVEMVHEFVPQGTKAEMVGQMIHHNASEGVVLTSTNAASESAGRVTESDSNLTPSNDVSHANDMEHDSGYGVTFDPNGMINDGPQDPDSEIFSVPPQDFSKAGTPQTRYFSTFATMMDETDHSSETEPATEIERELNPIETVANRTHEFEGLKNPNGKEQGTTFNVAFADDKPSVSSTLNTISSSTMSPQNPESQSTGVSSSTTKHAETNRGDFEMLQDAPYISSDHNQSKSDDIKLIAVDAKTKNPESSSEPQQASSSSHIVPDVPLATETPAVETSSSFIVHQTEQSVIRPVKIKFASPSDSSTSIQPASTSAEFLPNPSVPTTGSSGTTAGVETNPTDASSPIILPNPAPSTTAKGDGMSELITLLPELSSSPDKTGDTTETAGFKANSTIAGVAVKTSVSVSLPLSNSRNDTGSTLPSAFDELLKNSSIVILPGNPPTIIVRENNDTSTPASAESSSEGLTLTTTIAETTTAAGIRKPKIKVPGGSDTRTRRPYIPVFKRPTTTAGPPVSIFNKSRTRGASITSSTTAKPFRPLSTIRVHYASHIPGMVPGGELIISTEPVTEPPTTTEEYFSEEPFTDQTYTPSISSDDDVTLVKVAGYLVLERGIRWKDQLSNRHSLEYKEEAKMMHLHLERLFRSSSIAYRLWKIEIDGFSGSKKSRPVAVDFFLYLIKSHDIVSPDHLVSVLHEKLSVNNTFARFRVDPSRTAFERVAEERMIKTTPAPEQETIEPPIPQWAIAVIVIGAASLIFIVLFAAVTMYGRHHMRRRYSSKLNEEDLERSSGEWESKMAAAYENMAADTIYDAEDLHSDTYKKSRIATFHGIPSTLKRCDSWSSNGWTTPPKRKRPHVH